MASLNNQLFDLIILRNLVLEKVKNGLSNDVAKVYKSIFDDLIARLNQEDYINERNLNKIIKEFKEIIKPELTLFTDLEELALTESSFIIGATNAIVGAELFKTIPKDSTLLKISNTSLFNGYNSMETFKAFDDSLKRVIEGEIKQAIYQGEAIPEIRQRLINKAGIVDNQARTLARTFTSVVTNNVRQEVYENNEDVIKGYQYRAVLDSRTRIEHSVKDGVLYDINKKPIKHKYTYKTLPDGYNCRCVYVPITKSYKELGIDGIDEVPEGTRSSIDGQVPASTTFIEWFDKKDKAFQEKYLGKGRYELYKHGKINFSDLVSQRGEVLTISELKELK